MSHMINRTSGGLLDQRDEDWRDTLFYWHGKVSWVGGERNVMTWRGTWLSSVASHMPPASDFASSFNFFELNFDVDAERARHFQTGSLDLRLFLNMAADFRGHYLMEPPDGTGYRRAYRDDLHSFQVDGVIEDPPAEAPMAEEPTAPPAAPFGIYLAPPPARQPRLPGPYALVSARGSNEFGTFVSLGHARRCSAGADEGVELTLARRYVRDDDSRWRWPLSDMLRSVVAPIRACPWEHSLPCRLPADIIAAEAARRAQEPPPPPRPVLGQLAHHTAEYQAMMMRKRGRD